MVKILSWLVALTVFVAVASSTASVLRLRSANAHPVSAVASIAAGPQSGALTGPLRAPSKATAAAPKPKPRAPAPAKAAPVVHHAVAAAPSIVVRSTQQALINHDRARYGLRPLTWSSCLAGIAYSNAVRMASQGFISHTNGPTRDLGCHLGYHAGENVGWYSGGANDAWANTAFMNSPDHRANILSPYYHYVATSWVRAPGGRGYIAVEFS